LTWTGRLVAIAIALAIGAVAASSAYATAPTAFQCHKEYGVGDRPCLVRVKEPPGSSCANPFWIETTGFDQKGDKKYLTVAVIGKNPQAPEGVPWHVHIEVQVHNPHIVICPRTELKVWVWTVEEVERGHPGPGKLHTYSPMVEPELGEAAYTSRALTVPWGGYAAIATARWAHSSPAGGAK